VTYLEENAAADLELTDTDQARLDEAPPVGAAGDRYRTCPAFAADPPHRLFPADRETGGVQVDVHAGPRR
jgi:hypothetical protein